uniref:Essential MCU regulator, mitochondrial n=1 Tax=Athene cunicularia TaxID=194338 RepID=A0A663MRP6_ATHCN
SLPPRATLHCDLMIKMSLFPLGSLQTPFGLLRVFSVVIPFLYVGTQISKNFAALLEEHDIFVPEDDDDDD